MPDESEPKDPGAVWRGQPEEAPAANLERLMQRRAQELHSSTRAEIILSIGAALLFVAVIAWRLAPARDRLPRLGLAVIVAWAVISLYRFRDRIWPARPPRADALAATGLDYYRDQLCRRSDHLRNAWLWHGPLVLACAVLAAILIGNTWPGLERLSGALPLFVLLAGWTGFGFARRRRQVRQLQREIDEADRLRQ